MAQNSGTVLDSTGQKGVKFSHSHYDAPPDALKAALCFSNGMLRPQRIMATLRPAYFFAVFKYAASATPAEPSTSQRSLSRSRLMAETISVSVTSTDSSTRLRHKSRVMAPCSTPPAVLSEIVSRSGKSTTAPALMHSYITREFSG